MNVKAKYNLQLLTPAQRELEGIGLVYWELAGLDSARKMIDSIYEVMERLQDHEDLGIACRDKQLASQGYRMLICGRYLCFYRLIADTIFVYHIADGRADYPKLLADLK